MVNKENIMGVIPARYESTRFPGKPLANIGGKSMIQWVYEGVHEAFGQLVVATDDKRIGKAVASFGGNWIMTRKDHNNGTERCLEAVENFTGNGDDPEIVVNIQGDEPLLRAEQIRELLECFDQKETDIATLVKTFDAADDPGDPNLVKAVLGNNMQALYFSRSPIPYLRNEKTPPLPYLQHIGIYGFRTAVLREICTLPPSELETAESLEQLRWLENGYLIRASRTNYKGVGVDTPADINRVEKLL